MFFDIFEFVSFVSYFNCFYFVIYEIIVDFMNVDNFFVVFYEFDSNVVDFVYFIDEFDE